MSNKLMKNRNRCRGQSVISAKTTEFLQKICYKKAASVDMTQYGFARDSLLFGTMSHREEKRDECNQRKSCVRKAYLDDNVGEFIKNGPKNQKPNQPRFSNKVTHKQENKRKTSSERQPKSNKK